MLKLTQKLYRLSLTLTCTIMGVSVHANSDLQKFDNSGTQYQSSASNHAPSGQDSHYILRNSLNQQIFAESVINAKSMCAAIPECQSIFEVNGDYSSNGVAYKAEKSYLFSRKITPTKVSAMAGVVHVVQARTDFSVSPREHAPGYWDNDYLLSDTAGKVITRTDEEQARLYCTSNLNCRGIFQPHGSYFSNGKGYYKGSFYFFSRITPTKVPVLGGQVHTKNDYSSSAPQHAPGYWDHSYLIKNQQGQTIIKTSEADAKTFCMSRIDCNGIFQPKGNYSVRGIGYTPGNFYFFKRITATGVAPVTAGFVLKKRTLSKSEVDTLSALNHYRLTDFSARPSLDNASWSEGISAKTALIAKNRLWQDYSSYIASSRSGEMTNVTRNFRGHDVYEMKIDDKVMPFVVNTHGPKPDGGRPLLIMLHGGGSGTTQSNEDNWAGFLDPYRPPVVPDGALTVSPRSIAPAWNMWWLSSVDSFFDRLITNMIVFHGVNPNKVYITGYSAGGDGLYHLGPRMADRWAGALMSAGHPNGAKMESVFNTCFAIAMGEQDSAYDRYNVAVAYNNRLNDLQKTYGGFRHTAGFYPTGHGMGGRESREVSWIMKCDRNPNPGEILWNTRSNDRFYWLKTDENVPAGLLQISRSANNYTLKQAPADAALTLRFNDETTNFDLGVSIMNKDGQPHAQCQPSRKISVIVDTIVERGDPAQIYYDECQISLANKT